MAELLLPILAGLGCSLMVTAQGIGGGGGGGGSSPEPSEALRIGPIPGWTTAWHPAPANAAVPLGTELRFACQMEPGTLDVHWTGAVEQPRNGEWSIATCPMDQPGQHTVRVRIVSPDGDPSEDSCTFEVLGGITFDDAAIESIRPSVGGVHLDDGSTNATTMWYFAGYSFPGESVAALTPLRPSSHPKGPSYCTSIQRDLELAVEVTPTAFRSLVEWRLDGRPVGLGRRLERRLLEPGAKHVFRAGPEGRSKPVEIRTYSVDIHPPAGWSPPTPGVPITFTATTNPPGYEDHVRWLSSTKYGRATPVLGRGPSFTVAFEDTFGPDGAWYGVGGDDARLGADPFPPDVLPCSIEITAIIGARKIEVGNFDPLPDPHMPGRLFIDTVFDGSILAAPDRQNVRLTAKLTPGTFGGLDEYEVLWEVRDPDDPADHADADPNDGGTPRGGDNFPTDESGGDPTPADGVVHFFTLADHAISNQMTPGSVEMNAETVIGKATTQLDASGCTSVQFNHGDEGGDNYIITARCILKATGVSETHDSTGVQTVWRLRFVRVNGMEKPATDVQCIPVGANDGSPMPDDICVKPAASPPVNTYLAQGSDDLYSAPDGPDIVVGANGRSNTAANNGGPSFFPGASLQDVRDTLRTAYANPDPNRNAYIDPVVFEIGDMTTYDPELGLARAADSEEHGYSLDETSYHSGLAHPDNTYQLLGIRAFSLFMNGFVLGSTIVTPHCYVNLLAHYHEFSAGGTTSAEIRQTVVHELGHAIVPRMYDVMYEGIHTDHSAGFPCAGYSSAGNGILWCPNHAHRFRTNVTRTWPDHDNQVAFPTEMERDSDPDNDLSDFVVDEPTQSPGGGVAIRLQTELEEFELEDRPLVHVRFVNATAAAVTAHYPIASEPESLPSDLFFVFRDGRRLPYRRSPFQHPFRSAATTLRPGESYTLAVPIDAVAVIPPDGRAGHYRVFATGYYREHSPGDPAELTIRAGLARPAHSPLEDLLLSARWESADLGSTARRAELGSILARPGSGPGLRSRALRLTQGMEAFEALRRESILDPDPIVALAAIATISAPPAVEVVEVLAAAQDSPDVAVRRAAAEKLIGVGAALDALVRDELRRHHQQAIDERLRELLARVLGL